MKRLVTVMALAVCTLAIGSAKSYDLHLLNPTKAGNLELKPGEYRVKVEGNNVIFTDVNSSRKFTTPAKIEEVERKFEQTRMETTKQGDTDVLREIDLGGSRTKLEFQPS
jgi:hypothetical protein